MSWLSRGVKKLARSKLVRSAAGTLLSTVTPAIAQRVLSAGKSIGARIINNRIAKRQDKAVQAVVSKLQNMQPPSVVEMAKNPQPKEELWVGALASTKSKKTGRSKQSRTGSGSKKKAKSGSSSRTKASGSSKPAKAKKPNTRKQAFKAGNPLAEKMKAAAADWRKLSDEEKKAKGPWRKFLKDWEMD